MENLGKSQNWLDFTALIPLIFCKQLRSFGVSKRVLFLKHRLTFLAKVLLDVSVQIFKILLDFFLLLELKSDFQRLFELLLALFIG